MVCLLSNIVTPNFGPMNIDKGFLDELLAATCRVGYYPASGRDVSAPLKGIFMSVVPNSRGKTVLAAQLTAEL